jgi:hypothetical protein
MNFEQPMLPGMDPESNLRTFLDRLSKLSRDTGVVLSSCSCCDGINADFDGGHAVSVEYDDGIYTAIMEEPEEKEIR